MSPKQRPGDNPFSEYEREFEEYEKEIDREFDALTSEYDSILSAYGKLEAAFDDLSKAKDYFEFERKLKEFERLSDEFDRITGPDYAPSESDSDYKQDDQDEDSGLRGAWTIKTTTYIVPESYLRLMKIAKEIREQVEAEMKSEMEF